jgi:thymidylate synthase
MKPKAVSVEGRNVDETWFKIITNINNTRKYQITKGSFAGGYRYEFDKLEGVITNPIQYTDSGVMLPLAVTVPEGCSAPTTDEKIHEYYKHYLMNGQVEDNEHYKYGGFIVGGTIRVPHMSFYCGPTDKTSKLGLCKMSDEMVIIPDQLHWVLDHYMGEKKDGSNFGNNHGYIQVGYPELNQGYDYDENYSTPCLRGIDTKIIKEDGKCYICAHVFFRSWDLWTGFPTNMGGFALLLEYMAAYLGVEIGYLAFTSIKAHFYDYTISSVATRSGIEITV